MQADSRVFVAGHRGLVGSALVRKLAAAGFERLIVRTHDELDLENSKAVRDFFESERPEYVFLAAAKVGGILANDTYPADFIARNLAIQGNVIGESHRTGVRRLLFLGSSCIYPRDCPQPLSIAPAQPRNDGDRQHELPADEQRHREQVQVARDHHVRPKE